ncbi:MAG: hypothetical protein AAFP08_02530 [Bacteroidota bacterium]
MYVRGLVVLLILIGLSCEKDEPNLHEVDEPLRPIELRSGREVEETEITSSGPIISGGRELTAYLVPRLVAIMAQAELAETAFSRPTRVEWLRELRVDYRRVFNQLIRLGQQNNYPITTDLSVAMQRQVNALQNLTNAEFRNQYGDLLRDQLEQMASSLSTVAPGLSTDYMAIRRDMTQLINGHLDGLRQLF